MGLLALHLEVPEAINKADQLIGLMEADVAGEPLWPPPSLRVLVCVITGPPGLDDVAVIINDYDHFQKSTYRGDASYKTWLWIPLGRVLEQHPSLDIAQASPETRVKSKPQFAR